MASMMSISTGGCNWHTILKGANGLPLTEEERAFFEEVAEREPHPRSAPDFTLPALPAPQDDRRHGFVSDRSNFVVRSEAVSITVTDRPGRRRPAAGGREGGEKICGRAKRGNGLITTAKANPRGTPRRGQWRMGAS